MRNKIGLSIIFILVVFLSYSLNLHGGEPAVIVTVDGLSFVNTLVMPGSEPIDDTEHYLKTALENMNLALEDTSIHAFHWSRDANDTIETVETLRDFLVEKYQNARTNGKRFIVVAHSWGTVLSYLALSSQSQQAPANERVFVDLYITLGSPLGTDNAHTGFNYPEETIVINYTGNWTNQYDFCSSCLPLVDEWVNYWAWGDVISGPFQGFMPFDDYSQWSDIKIDSNPTSGGYATRNITTTVTWHKYDSLQAGGIVDNQPLLDMVKNRIEDEPATDISPPFGGFDTPVDGSLVSGSVPVTGWALDDIAVAGVKIYREPVNGEGNALIYIGDVVFVEGARPDIEGLYPGYPDNHKAGWGYMMLTHFLPGKGNGTCTLHAVAADTAGHTVTLGTKTMVCDNAGAVKPFGAIDTPTPGGTASGGGYRNVGWVLTPMPNKIPGDGSTIHVYVDGVDLGHPVYDVYREDIAALFPGYANSNAAAAYFDLDTTIYENGLHTIAWTAQDDAGNEDGIGSRYFSVQNSQGTRKSAEGKGRFNIPTDYLIPVEVIKGYGRDVEPRRMYPGKNGIITVEINQLERVEIHFPNPVSNLSPLPVGSTMDSGKGIFYWGPGPGFVGTYNLVFITPDGTHLKRITIKIL